MATTLALPAPESVLTELSRYFAIAVNRARDGGITPMFSAYLDEQWHALLDHPGFTTWCRETVGHVIRHQESSGHGQIDWVGEYERQHGLLSKLWFASADGTVNHPAMHGYRATGMITASWRCDALDGDDGDDAPPASANVPVLD
jgi:hypothetical protein